MFSKKEGQQSSFNSTVDTLIGKETALQGSLEASGTIRIDGKFEGKAVIKGDLFVGESSVMNADISTKNMILAGKLKGNVECEGRLEILETGKLEGDIKVANLTINEGAIFRGKSEMLQSAETGVPEVQLANNKEHKKGKSK